VAARHDLRAVVCNVEMNADVLIDKLLARLARVDVTALMNRDLTDPERDLIAAAVNQHAEALGRIAFHRGSPTVPSVYDSTRAFDARVLVIDYLHRFALEAQR
jgi:replicative DNA helicase